MQNCRKQVMWLSLVTNYIMIAIVKIVIVLKKHTMKVVKCKFWTMVITVVTTDIGVRHKVVTGTNI